MVLWAHTFCGEIEINRRRVVEDAIELHVHGLKRLRKVVVARQGEVVVAHHMVIRVVHLLPQLEVLRLCRLLKTDYSVQDVLATGKVEKGKQALKRPSAITYSLEV